MASGILDQQDLPPAMQACIVPLQECHLACLLPRLNTRGVFGPHLLRQFVQQAQLVAAGSTKCLNCHMTHPLVVQGIVGDVGLRSTNYLTHNRTYATLGSTTVLAAEPSVVHFGGFELGQVRADEQSYSVFVLHRRSGQDPVLMQRKEQVHQSRAKDAMQQATA
jgi:hypothetical protein